MTDYLLLAAGAFWIGVLTAISPCPLATNIAAVSYVSHRADRQRLVLWSGILYAAGRSLTYIVLSALIVGALVNVPVLSDWLQRHMNQALGFLLVLVGMVLLGLLPVPLPQVGPSEQLQRRVDRLGLAGAFLLGAVFALAFCPVSAALFFGSLVPLAVKADSRVGLPLLYGVGTAVPVLVFAGLVAAGSPYLARVYREVTRLGEWIRRITGVVLVVIGVYYCLRYIFGLW
ncbi:sulfite exporter TauE/SafE family protein [bacterium]|nr:sulfite exporter TauE/SafE family protein [bacterium]